MSLIIAAGLAFVCTPISVWDGDGPIWCAEGPRIRLSGIAAREIDETCKPNQPCPDASGHVARDYLVRLLGGSKGQTADGHIKVSGVRLTCVSFGNGKGSRTAALCSLGRKDLSCAMVESGMALRWRRYGGDKICT